MQQQPPLIQQGWQRVVVFLVCYLLLILLAGNLWSGLASGATDNNLPFIYLPLLYNFVVGVLLVAFFRKAFDRNSFRSLGWTWKGFGTERIAGLLSALVLICGLSSVLWAMQLLQWYTSPVDVTALLLATVMMVVVAMGEELVFRGYLLHNLMASAKKETALLLSALLFAVFHSLNPDFNLTAFLNIFLAGLVLGVNYIFTRNLWFGIFFHFTWNWIQGPVLGFQVSGLELPTLLQQDLQGSILLTGGRFGLEGSWLTSLFLALAFLVLYLVFQKRYPAPTRLN